jgi:hypothetical protein
MLFLGNFPSLTATWSVTWASEAALGWSHKGRSLTGFRQAQDGFRADAKNPAGKATGTNTGGSGA